MEQSGTAKCLPGQVLLNWLTAAADGHGGIRSIDPVGTSGLVDTYRITLADTTTYDFSVTNGRGIESWEKTGTSGLVDTYAMTLDDGTAITYTVKNGEKGDKGNNVYTWVKYASQEPTEESHSMGDIPDDWRGEYNGPLAEAPTDWKQYKWYKIKGDKGDPGSPATLLSSVTEYLTSDSGTIIPSGSWTVTVPAVAPGKYLWTRVTQTYNTGSPVVSYSVSRMGIDGLGSVSSVNEVSPDSNGNVQLTPNDVGAVALDGSNTMVGDLPMGLHKIVNLADPEDAADAATKGYSDTKADLPKTVSGTVISLDDASDGPLQGLRIYGKTTQDGTPTPEAPVDLVSVGDGGSIGVRTVGKNILQVSDYNVYAKDNTTVASIDGGYKVASQVTTASTIYLYVIIGLINAKEFEGQTLSISCKIRVSNSNVTPAIGISLRDTNGTKLTELSPVIRGNADYKATFTVPACADSDKIGAILYVANGSAANANDFVEFYDFQVEVGAAATDYEPYTPQTLTLSTPNGLPGIPVTSGGNYTDADGQQWICDEVDLARGVYVQRIGTIDSYAGEAVSEPYLSTTGALSTGAKVLYVLATPIATPIPEDELAAYAAIHTNKPNTTIYNDAGAHMDVGYYTPNATMLQADIAKDMSEKLPKSGGTMTGPIAMGGSQVTDLGEPTATGDAATKGYVDGRQQAATATLTAAGWSSNTQTVSVSGVTASNTVIVAPDPASFAAYTESGIRCTAQASGTLTFACEDVPAADLAVNVVILA